MNRLIVFKGPVPFSEVRNWFRPEFKAVQNKVLWRLKQLQILQGRGQEVWINPSFQSALFSATAPSNSTSLTLNLSDLDNFAKNRWESVLYELVKDSNDSAGTATKRVRRDKSSMESMLVDAGLISDVGKVTNSGFQFLLKDISSQVWILLLHYLKSCQNDSNLLQFLADQILWGRAGVGLQVNQSGLPAEHLKKLDDFGLIMLSSEHFSVTRLLASLSASKNALDFTDILHNSNNGFLIIESNYRVYAYTSSPLQIATLGLFVKLQDRFPNMVYGQLTGESVQAALSHGLSAEQIIQYLQLNAHPSMIRNNQPFNGIPFTVIDQIRLWELDRKRLGMKPGHLYQQFLSEQEYSAALEEAKTIGAVLYAKPSARVLIISEEGHEHMKQFCRKK